MSSLPPGVDLFGEFTRRFDEAGVEYLVTGSVAAMLYGESRLTMDIDLIAAPDLDGLLRLTKLFSSEVFYFPPMEVLTAELMREARGHFNIIHIPTSFKADVYLRGSDPLRIWALQNARRFPIKGMMVQTAPPEYVIIRKLEYFREGGSEKHLRDIRQMLKYSQKAIDFGVLNRFVAERGLEASWAKAQVAGL